MSVLATLVLIVELAITISTIIHAHADPDMVGQTVKQVTMQSI